MSDFEPGGEVWEEAPDLTDISQEELKERLDQLVVEEREISYRRRVIQGRIDLIRAEMVRRGGVVLTPEELARVLMGGSAEPGDTSGEERGSGESGS